MISLRTPSLATSLLVVALTLACIPAPPAWAQSPIFALEQPLTLPPETDPHGHTPPGVALGEDGGFVSAWMDLDTGRVIGRRFDPANPTSPSDGEIFELTGEGASSGSVTVTRGGPDRFLAVWKQQAPGGSDALLAARAFDGRGVPLEQSFLLVDQPARSYAVAARPTGGFILAWWSIEPAGQVLRFRFLGPNGEPAGGSTQVARLPADGVGALVHLAVDADGRFLVTWSYTDRALGRAGVFGRGYAGTGQAIGQVATLVDPVQAGSGIDHDVASTGPGRYLLAWAPPADASSLPVMILARPFDDAGSPTGLERRIDGGLADAVTLRPRVAGRSDGAAAIAWREHAAQGNERLRALLVDPEGRARSGRFDVVEPPLVDGSGTGGINRIALDLGPGGRLVFGWGVSLDVPILPSGEHLNWTSGARRYQETDPACHPVLTAELHTEPAEPVAGEPVRLVFDGLADCAEVTLLDWRRELGGVRVEALAEGLICGTVPPFPYTFSVDAGPFEDGTQEAILEVSLPGGDTCLRRFAFEVAEGEPGTPPPPPDAEPLTSPALPGFEVWVRITPQNGPVILGAAASGCIPETLCVTGALPDRPEVFVRVVGPKPNGFLWPTLVKFSTSTVEVWIEQVATGDTEYYRLEGASPGNDVLPGLFDRTGFEPL